MKTSVIRRTVACAAALAALTLSGAVAPAHAISLSVKPTPDLTTLTSVVQIPDGDYYLALHDDRGKGLNIQGASTAADKAAVVVDTLNGESHEIFQVVNRGNGLISIHPRHQPSLALNALMGSACEKGQPLTIHAYQAGDSASLWRPIRNADGSMTLQSAACAWVIDVNKGDYTDGNHLLLWEQTGNSRIQSFFFDPVTSNSVPAAASLAKISDGNYYIALHDDRGKGLNIQFASKVADKAAVVVDTLNGESNEIFQVVNRGNGLISLHPQHSPSLALNALMGSACVKGQSLTIHAYQAGDTASLWRPLQNADGSVTLQSAACAWVIDVNKGDYTDGNHLLLWEKTGNSRIQSFYFVPVTASATAPAATGYAAYTGVNYRAQTSDSRRIAICDKAVQMMTVLWTAPCDFPCWKSASGVYNSVTAVDGTRSTKFISGKTYQGIPYSMAGRGYDDIKWKALVAGGMTTSSMSTYYDGRKDTTAKGIDCSYLVCTALNAAGVGGSIDLNTSAMLTSSNFRKISLAQMVPGDLFLKSGHTMLFMGMTSAGKYAVIEANADVSRVVYNEYSASSLSAYGSYRFARLG